MTDLDYLGEPLREQLHTLVADVNPSAALLAAIDAIPETEGRRRFGALRQRFAVLRRRRLSLVLPVPVAGAAVAIVALLSASNPAPSVGGAVKQLANGEVQVSIQELMNPPVANAIFRRVHLNDIVVVPLTPSCPNRNMTYTAGEMKPSPIMFFTRNGARGWKVVVGAKRIAKNWAEDAVGRFRGHIPTCASSRGTGAGMSSFSGKVK